jgi:hypothetical protein
MGDRATDRRIGAWERTRVSRNAARIPPRFGTGTFISWQAARTSDRILNEMHGRTTDRGASLVGLVVIVVVLGALTAGGIVSVQGMTGSDGGSPTTVRPVTAGAAGSTVDSATKTAALNACNAMADAARSASTMFFVNRQRYPRMWPDLTAAPNAVFTLAANDVVNPNNARELDGVGWRLVMSEAGATPPVFTCH